jgi:hypothetical protein
MVFSIRCGTVITVDLSIEELKHHPIEVGLMFPIDLSMAH